MQEIFSEFFEECDKATSWQLQGLGGNYGVYMAVTGSTWHLLELTTYFL